MRGGRAEALPYIGPRRVGQRRPTLRWLSTDGGTDKRMGMRGRYGRARLGMKKRVGYPPKAGRRSPNPTGMRNVRERVGHPPKAGRRKGLYYPRGGVIRLAWGPG